MHRWRSALHLGMPHTISGALFEVALLAHLQDVQWTGIGELTGTPASRHVDASGREVYASIYFVDLDGLPPAGLGAFRPDDDLDIVSSLGRYGQTMLEAEHALFSRGVLAPGLPEALPPGARVRLSNVLVALGSGPEDLRIATPANARLDVIPTLPARPDSYRLIREAEARGSFGLVPPDARRLLGEVAAFTLPVNPDRDLNGVGLLYFANYVAFMDAAERA